MQNCDLSPISITLIFVYGQAQHKLHSFSSFSGLVGLIDGTHISLQVPVMNEEVSVK